MSFAQQKARLYNMTSKDPGEALIKQSMKGTAQPLLPCIPASPL